MIIIGIIILAVAFTLGIIANKSTKFLIYVTLSLAGIGWATINVNSYPMIVEMSKEAMSENTPASITPLRCRRKS